jgi:hypothetical protein
MIAQRFRVALRRLDLQPRLGIELRTDLFEVPPQAGDQLSLL